VRNKDEKKANAGDRKAGAKQRVLKIAEDDDKTPRCPQNFADERQVQNGC
jgi:hypothetical protein